MGCAKITFVSCAAIAAAMLLSSCSIRDETSDEILVQEESEEIVLKKPRTKSEFFIQKCIECAAGDLTNLAEIVETYQSTFTNSTDYPSNAFLYQRINNHQAFENCALKARLEGDTIAFDSMIVQPNKIARIARYFYAYNQPTQGAYWLQRIINIRGEVLGLEVAGRIFIQDIRTIGIGVQLLEQSARLGNRTAGQMLTGLMTPGSPYYNQLTTNNTNDYDSAKDRTSGQKQAESSQESTDLKTSLDNIVEHNNQELDQAPQATAAGAARAAAAAGASARAQSSPTTADSKGIVIFDSSSKSETKSTSDTKQDIGSGTTVKPSTAKGDANKPRIRDYRDDVDVGSAPRSNASPIAPQAIQGASLERTEDILQSSDADLNIPLEIYEQAAQDYEKRGGGSSKAMKSASERSAASEGTSTTHSDKDINEAHKRLLERHEERLKQAQEKAEAAAQAASKASN